MPLDVDELWLLDPDELWLLDVDELDPPELPPEDGGVDGDPPPLPEKTGPGEP